MIRHPFLRVKFRQPAAKVIDLLVRDLPSTGLRIERVERDKGEIWAHGVAKAMDMILWRCYADRFLFEVKATGESQSQVDGCMIVNLLLWPRRKEQLVDSHDVIRRVLQLAARFEVPYSVETERRRDCAE